MLMRSYRQYLLGKNFEVFLFGHFTSQNFENAHGHSSVENIRSIDVPGGGARFWDETPI